MSRAMAATKGSELNDQISVLVTTASGYVSADNFVIRRLGAEVEKLATTSAAEASLCRAMLAMAQGDWPGTERWCANAYRLGAAVDAMGIEFIARCNLGYFSQAASIYADLTKPRWGVISKYLTHGSICGAFCDVIAGAQACSEFKIELGDSHLRAVEVAMKAHAVVARLGVSEQDVQAMLDVAGEVLRERRVFWLGPNPQVAVLDNEDGAGLLYQMEVAVDAQQASALSDEVVMRMVQRDLDKPGLAFSFLSVAPDC